MGLNRLRGMWLSEEEPGQAFLFKDIRTAEADFQPVMPRKADREEPRPYAARPEHLDSDRLYNALSEQLRILLDQCLDVVSRDPEVALNTPPASWELWFQEPLLSSVRRSTLPLALKLRLLAFLALMLPFLDEREQERVKMTIAGLSPANSQAFGEILTEQDLLHTQWLVQSIRRSKDIKPQMEALRRSILARVPATFASS
ncbi:MAG: hypothetical protein HUU16_09380 [Candidatus Omnitrophica bacterium]|nr:hypothetical protein [Candidatus Omnitrophota bacterium]